MKSKSAQAAFDAFSKMINIKKPTSVPIKFWTDQGKEFKGYFRKHCELKFIALMVIRKVLLQSGLCGR